MEEEKLVMSFTKQERLVMRLSLMVRERSIFVRFNQLLDDLIERLMFSEGEVSFTRDEMHTILTSLLMFKTDEKQNAIITPILPRLWTEQKDRRKEEALWTMEFRAELDKWGIPYKEELIRLGVPEHIEAEE